MISTELDFLTLEVPFHPMLMIWSQWFICDHLYYINTSEQDIKKFISCQNKISYLFSKQICICKHVASSGARSSYSYWNWVFMAQENQLVPLGICLLLLILLQKSSSTVPLQVVAIEIKMMSIRTVLGMWHQEHRASCRVWDLVSSYHWLAKTKQTNWEADLFTPETFVH